ncbi:CapA family protein [Paenibacillus agricola]|uniref:CapA family protein n=1 Tax=Paenibacillus agricola TaxID=2716264 RepID=A0ABX0J6N3_9BACL|nr:CapA family protein [Paenibacillus agricola]NHN31802.1 CapA family protein [Paenibacillus agricola]
MQEITIAAVGDILINGAISMSVKNKGTNLYNFDSIFESVAPYLQAADLTIGNLEVPLMGDTPFIKKKNPLTGYPIFNAPEPLASALKRNGFDVIITANNHCLDQGVDGMLKTLQVLDDNDLAHTGTNASLSQSRNHLIKDVKGIKVGILAYTKSTNRIPIPKHMPFAVNLLNLQQIKRDLQEIKHKTDLNIVYLHFGKEYHQKPSLQQKKLVNSLLLHGADIILGSHPHVLQPLLRKSPQQLAIYSLGNFVSIRLKNNPYTNNGLILQLTIQKNGSQTLISDIDGLPTWTYRKFQKGKATYRVLPNIPWAWIQSSLPQISPKQRALMERMQAYTLSFLQADSLQKKQKS